MIKHRSIETEARGDVDEYLKECIRCHRVSLAFRAKERRQYATFVKQKADDERRKRNQHTKNVAIDTEYYKSKKRRIMHVVLVISLGISSMKKTLKGSI